MTRVFAVLAVVVTMTAPGLVPNLAWAQGDSRRPAAEISAAIGKVLAITGTVTVEHTSAVVLQANLVNGTADAKVGDFVYLGDVIQTGVNSTAGIVFGDGTSFNVSSNARMELNEFVYDPKSSSNSTLISLKKGAFTFVAGQIAKNGNMKVDTPVGTMGIRGTAPRVEILEDGTVRFSTLVEEHKNARPPAGGPGTTPAAVPPLRRTENTTPSDDITRQNADTKLARKLIICRGC